MQWLLFWTTAAVALHPSLREELTSVSVNADGAVDKNIGEFAPLSIIEEGAVATAAETTAAATTAAVGEITAAATTAAVGETTAAATTTAVGETTAAATPAAVGETTAAAATTVAVGETTAAATTAAVEESGGTKAVTAAGKTAAEETVDEAEAKAEAKAEESAEQNPAPISKDDADDHEDDAVAGGDEEVTKLVPTMKWITAHLKTLDTQPKNMEKKETKIEATKKTVAIEKAKFMDKSHTINVQYLQSLDYDREMAPPEFIADGETYPSNAVNDQVGLADMMGAQDAAEADKEGAEDGTVVTGKDKEAIASNEVEVTKASDDVAAASTEATAASEEAAATAEAAITEGAVATTAAPAAEAAATEEAAATTAAPAVTEEAAATTTAAPAVIEEAAATTTEAPDPDMEESLATTLVQVTAKTKKANHLSFHAQQRGTKLMIGGKRAFLHDGDMLMTLADDDTAEPLDWNLWPFGVVTYTLHSSIGVCARSVFEAAIFDIEKYTCVRFKEHRGDGAAVWRNVTSETPILMVTAENTEGCFAGIGYKKATRTHNILNIGSGCEYPGTVLHELGHVLGLAHEQARYDRDLFVNVVWENMISEEEFKAEHSGDLTGEFRVLKDTNSSWEATNEWFEYDYGSIMHFGSCEFSHAASDGVECAASLTSVIDGGQELMGNRQQMSEKDIATINTMYACDNTCGDKVQNQEETSIDCGGPNCGPCETPFSKVADNCPLASAWNKRMTEPSNANVWSVGMVAALLVFIRD